MTGAAAAAKAKCGECLDSGRVLGDEGMESCTRCRGSCWRCHEDVPRDYLTTRVVAGIERRICHGCATAKCNGCGREFALVQLHDESGCCEECHVPERIEGPVSASEAFDGW